MVGATPDTTGVSAGQSVRYKPRYCLSFARHGLPRAFLVFVTLLLTGCPPEERYIVNNFLGADIRIRSASGDISVRNSDVVIISSYEHAFELNKAGNSLLKFSSGTASRCFILDIASYQVDPDLYYGGGSRSVLQIVLLPDGDARAIPYNHRARTEVQDGSGQIQATLPEMPGSQSNRQRIAAVIT